MADETGDRLRDLAEHRGLKLVKSRRRKPGTGDFGKFGLTDAAGKALLGIGDDGLTASPEDIEAYLRQGATSTWKASTEAAPERTPATARKASSEDTDSDSLPAIRPRAKRAAGKPDRAARKNERASGAATLAASASRRNANGRSGKVGSDEPIPLPKAVSKRSPEPAAKLVVRAARSADAAALAPLLAQLAHIDIDELAIARNLDAVRKAKGGMAVAEWGKLVGFCGWALLSTVQHGLVGRVTLLLVDERHRRRGIATALVKTAADALSKAGCARMEVMSDIEIANAHGFFRSLGFEQTSYRFARETGGGD